MLEVLNKINAAVWGLPTLLLILFTGITLSVRTKFFQIRFLRTAFKSFFKKTTVSNNNRMTPLQSASTALSATLGTGNIIGVAGAIALGGPGAVFWMWVSALFCMIVKFSEITLSIRFRKQNRDGSYSGGAMYYIKNALPDVFAPLATVFCVFGVAAAFGVGNMTQINAISASVNILLKSIIFLSPRAELFTALFIGVICAILCAIVLKNEVSIGRFCEKLMPAMTLLYIGMTVLAIAIKHKNIPSAFSQIFIGAFSPQSVTGGVIGSAFIGMRFGVARGVFSNEAGLGTAPISYACSDGDELELGLMGIVEVFVDTIIICTLTALTILCVGDVSYGIDTSTTATLKALSSVYGRNIIYLFCPIVCFFAFSSVIGWGLYGTKFIAFLLGEKSRNGFLILFVLAMIPAAVFRAETVWIAAEILNGLMCLPNLTAVLLLSNNVSQITDSATKKHRLSK